MSTNAGIVSDTFKYVTQKTEQLNTLQKLDDRIESEAGEQEHEEEAPTTTKEIF